MSALEQMVGAMTVGELARRSGRSLEDLLTVAIGSNSGGPPPARPAAAVRSAEASVPRGGLDLTAVLSALASVRGPAKLEDVRAKVGGSVPQVRSALQKLATAGMLDVTGERRGTRYVARR